MDFRRVVSRNAKRHRVRHPVVLETLPGGSRCEGRLEDLSTHGACAELTTGDLTIGNIVRAEVHLDQLGKSHVLHAEVVWALPPALSRQRRVGLRFVGHAELRRLGLAEQPAAASPPQTPPA